MQRDKRKKMMKTMLKMLKIYNKKKKNLFICFFVCHARAKMIFKMLKKSSQSRYLFVKQEQKIMKTLLFLKP
jgi:hypothetical protein